MGGRSRAGQIEQIGIRARIEGKERVQPAQPSLVRSKRGPGQGQVQGQVDPRAWSWSGAMATWGGLVVSRERQTNNTTHLQVHPT